MHVRQVLNSADVSRRVANAPAAICLMILVGMGCGPSGQADGAPPQAPQARTSESPVRYSASPVRYSALNDIERQEGIPYARIGDRNLELDLFWPRSFGDSPRPAIVLVHGGGWKSGDRSRFKAFAQDLARRGFVTAAIDYRLAGEAPFPAAVQDVLASIRWLRTNAERYRIDSQRIAAVGGSAGGHLVGLAAAAADVPEFVGQSGEPRPSSSLQAAVVMAGPLELATGPVAEKSRKQPQQSNANLWIGKTVDQAPELYRLGSASTHMDQHTAPILFVCGELDQPQRNAAARERLQELGKVTGINVYWKGKHGCWNRHPWYDRIVDDVHDYLLQVLQLNPTKVPFETQQQSWGTLQRTAQGLTLEITSIPENGRVSIPALHNPVESVQVEIDGKQQTLKLVPGIEAWEVLLPKSAASASKVQVTTVGFPRWRGMPMIVSPVSEGQLVLPAHMAFRQGEMLRYEPQPHKNTLGYWVNEADHCGWHFYVEHPGKYEVTLLQGCGKGQGGSTVALVCDQQRLDYQVFETGHFQNFVKRTAGVLEFDNVGVYTIIVQPVKKAAKAIMDIRELQLKRVD